MYLQTSAHRTSGRIVDVAAASLDVPSSHISSRLAAVTPSRRNPSVPRCYKHRGHCCKVVSLNLLVAADADFPVLRHRHREFVWVLREKITILGYGH
jgi:hypothetical protein